MTGFKSHVTRWNPHLVPLLCQEFMATQVIDPKRKVTTLILLLFCNVKLIVIPTYYLSLNPYQRSFEVDNDKERKSQLAKVQRLREVRRPSPKWNLYINPLFQRLRDHFRRAALEIYGPKGSIWLQGNTFWTQQGRYTFEFTVCMHNTCSSSNQTISNLERKLRHQLPTEPRSYWQLLSIGRGKVESSKLTNI